MNMQVNLTCYLFDELSVLFLNSLLHGYKKEALHIWLTVRRFVQSQSNAGQQLPGRQDF